MHTADLENGLSPEITDKIFRLAEKYAVMGQDLNAYLDGLLYADYLTYWDYIHLDTLLSLQSPKTPFKDELIFILYHQTTELYFKLILHAADQICNAIPLPVELFIKQVKRMNSYWKVLVSSFEIMIEGMDKDQFLSFRMSLLPASGFQSAQYRKIEIYSTNIENLIALNKRNDIILDNETAALLPHFYWKQGATELATGKKTLTLKQFEQKYDDEFIRLIDDLRHKNLLMRYMTLPETARNNPELIAQMRQYDHYANVIWPLMHYKSAVRYLHRDPQDIAATGGSNWQKYLPPKYQKIMFFPLLWSLQEREEWGKNSNSEL